MKKKLGLNATLTDLRQDLVDNPITDVDYIIGEIDPEKRRCNICLRYKIDCRDIHPLAFPSKKYIVCPLCRTKLRNFTKIS